MREILRIARTRDAEAARWLEIVDLFDRLIAGGASVEELAHDAARATGRPVGLREVWNGHLCQVGGQAYSSSITGAEVSRAAVAHGLRGREAAGFDLSAGAALAASVEIGAGRIGVAWLLAGAGVHWGPLDYLVVERLAAAIGAHALEVRGGGPADTVAVDRLLAGGLSEYELAQVSRRAGLSLGRRYAVVALDQTPPNAFCPEALGAIVERALGCAGIRAVSAVVGRSAVVLAEADPELEPALRALTEQEAELSLAIGAGVSEPSSLDGLADAWKQAREALTLREMVAPGGRVAAFGDLGDLHLLAQIPGGEILAAPLMQRLIELADQHAQLSDVEVLECYLDEGTLRGAATRLFLHHTSVKHRIKRLQEGLEVDLADAAARFDIHLTIKLYRILQAQDSAQTL